MNPPPPTIINKRPPTSTSASSQPPKKKATKKKKENEPTHLEKLFDAHLDPLDPGKVAPVDLRRLPLRAAHKVPEEVVLPVAQLDRGPLAVARVVIRRDDGLVAGRRMKRRRFHSFGLAAAAPSQNGAGCWTAGGAEFTGRKSVKGSSCENLRNFSGIFTDDLREAFTHRRAVAATFLFWF